MKHQNWLFSAFLLITTSTNAAEFQTLEKVNFRLAPFHQLAHGLCQLIQELNSDCEVHSARIIRRKRHEQLQHVIEQMLAHISDEAPHSVYSSNATRDPDDILEFFANILTHNPLRINQPQTTFFNTEFIQKILKDIADEPSLVVAGGTFEDHQRAEYSFIAINERRNREITLLKVKYLE